MTLECQCHALTHSCTVWRAGIVRTQRQTESTTYGNSNLNFDANYIDYKVYISTTLIIRNNIPGFVVKVVCVSLAVMLHLTITILQARTLLKRKAEDVEATQESKVIKEDKGKV